MIERSRSQTDGLHQDRVALCRNWSTIMHDVDFLCEVLEMDLMAHGDILSVSNAPQDCLQQ